MRVIHNNVTIDLPDGDPRVQVIELLLFGRSALPLYGAPPGAPAAPVPEKKPAPPVKVPPSFARFWAELPQQCREELALLAKGPQQVDVLGRAFRLPHARALQGLHFQLNRVARKHRIGAVLERVGHDRKNRCFRISDEHAAWVRALTAA